jgi:hypothetical protein
MSGPDEAIIAVVPAVELQLGDCLVGFVEPLEGFDPPNIGEVTALAFKADPRDHAVILVTLDWTYPVRLCAWDRVIRARSIHKVVH